MVRFSVLKNRLRNHVRQMYQEWLLNSDNSPNIERIKSIGLLHDSLLLTYLANLL